MKRGRWLIALQLLLWCLLAPPFALIVASHPGLPRFTYVFALILIAALLFFFNFKLYEKTAETITRFFLYLLMMAVITLIAGVALFWVTFYASAFILGEVI